MLLKNFSKEMAFAIKFHLVFLDFVTCIDQARISNTETKAISDGLTHNKSITFLHFCILFFKYDFKSEYGIWKLWGNKNW